MSDKTLKTGFIQETLVKIQKVLDLVLKYYGVNMSYDIEKRNELFCEIIKKTKKELTTTETFEKIQETMWSNPTTPLGKLENEWLSKNIYEYHRDIFLLHYFYAVLYSYNYDVQIREKVTEEQIKKFFAKANEIYKKYKNLSNSETENA